MNQLAFKRKTLQLLMQPVLRYCLRNSLGIQDVIDAAKGAFVPMASKELESVGDKVTISRLIVMTGIHRKEVLSIMNEDDFKDTTPHCLQRVLNRWEQTEEFLDSSGEPLALQYKGKESDFTKLVLSVRKDLNPNAVRRELKRTGSVFIKDACVHLRQAQRFTNKSPEDGMELLGRDVETLVRIVEENVHERAEDPVRNLHLRTSYNNIYEEDLPVIREWLLRQGQAFHKKARQFLANYDQDLNFKPGKKAGKQVVLTSFGWTEEDLDK
jgi:hypothetical protein